MSYPAPTFSAVKGIFESILWLKSATVVPVRVEICAPVMFHTYTTNYGGPLRKSSQRRDGTPYQLLAVVLVDVCYRLYARVVRDMPPIERLSEVGRQRLSECTNGAHAYEEIFNRRLSKGQFYRTPCLGWQEFVPEYLGVFRAETRVQEDLNLVVPSMLHTVFGSGKFTPVAPKFRQDVRIDKGVLEYAP